MKVASETQVGTWARAWLQDLGWDTYAEVEVRGLSGRPDIVGRRGPLVLIGECKTSASLSVIGQVLANEGLANYRYVFTPWARDNGTFRLLCRRFGVGFVMAGAEQCREVEAPRFLRRADTSWTTRLCDEHKTIAEAGSARGGYWTPFRATCKAVLAYVLRHQGASTREVVDAVSHHYASSSTARSALLIWAKAGKIPCVRVDYGEKSYRWYADEASP